MEKTEGTESEVFIKSEIWLNLGLVIKSSMARIEELLNQLKSDRSLVVVYHTCDSRPLFVVRRKAEDK